MIMKLFQNLFNKNHDLNEEEQQKFNSMVGEEQLPMPSTPLSQTPRDFVSSLSSLEEINKIRNLLDTREKELESGDMYLVDSQINHESAPEFESIPVQDTSVSEKNIEEPITENDLNHETYEEESSSYNKNEVSGTYEEENSYTQEDTSSQMTFESQTNETTNYGDTPQQNNYSDNLNVQEETSLSTESPELEFGSTSSEVEFTPEPESYESLDKEDQSNPLPEEILLKDNKETVPSGGIQFDIEPEEEDNDFVDLTQDSTTPLKETFSSSAMDLYLEKVSSIFGAENIISIQKEQGATSFNPTKKLLHIGIRNRDRFGHGDMNEENAWFIGQVKQLDDLKSYKMLKSEKGLKDLIKEEDSHITIISFRATPYLNSMDEFDFEL